MNLFWPFLFAKKKKLLQTHCSFGKGLTSLLLYMLHFFRESAREGIWMMLFPPKSIFFIEKHTLVAPVAFDRDTGLHRRAQMKAKRPFNEQIIKPFSSSHWSCLNALLQMTLFCSSHALFEMIRICGEGT